LEIKVCFYAFFREYSPEQALQVSLEPGKDTIGDLIQVLKEHLGEKFSREVASLIKGNRELQGLVYVGSKSILRLDKLSTRLKPGDTVKFLPPMAGG
jgi:molybdopterin converting factor small subunit